MRKKEETKSCIWNNERKERKKHTGNVKITKRKEANKNVGTKYRFIYYTSINVFYRINLAEV